MPASATPTGFRQDAIAFLAAAEFLLNREDGSSLPAYFLFARSIELSLKAFLLQTGSTEKELKSRPLGHNLTALYEKAARQGKSSRLALSSVELGVLDLLSKEYIETRLGYRVSGSTYLLPLIEVTERVAKELVHLIDS
jgi:HEPN domain-containing protein